MGPVSVQVGLFLFLLSFALSFVVVSLYSSWLARTSPGTLFHVAVAHPHCTCSLLVFLLQGCKATGSSESPQSRYSVGLGVCKATIIHKNTNQIWTNCWESLLLFSPQTLHSVCSYTECVPMVIS